MKNLSSTQELRPDLRPSEAMPDPHMLPFSQAKHTASAMENLNPQQALRPYLLQILQGPADLPDSDMYAQSP